MSVSRFEALPASSRLWCFGADRDLSGEEERRIRDSVEGFLATWAAHGSDLSAGCEVRDGRFLLVAADESGTAASGCAVDGLVRHLKALEAESGARLVDGQGVWYRDAGGHVRSCSRTEFKRLAEIGEVGPSTLVFDLSLTRLEDARSGRWETRAADAWHASLLVSPAAGGSA